MSCRQVELGNEVDSCADAGLEVVAAVDAPLTSQDPIESQDDSGNGSPVSADFCIQTFHIPEREAGSNDTEEPGEQPSLEQTTEEIPCGDETAPSPPPVIAPESSQITETPSADLCELQNSSGDGIFVTSTRGLLETPAGNIPIRCRVPMNSLRAQLQFTRLQRANARSSNSVAIPRSSTQILPTTSEINPFATGDGAWRTELSLTQVPSGLRRGKSKYKAPNDKHPAELSETYLKLYAELPRPKRAWGENGEQAASDPYIRLCAYAMFGQCRFGPQCMNVHGLRCDFCGVACLDPYNLEAREYHKKECVKRHEENMKHSFRVAMSKDRNCGICFEIVLKRAGTKSDRRFGILPSCSHAFCLSCIRKWRSQKNSYIDRSSLKACPACRTTADHVIPSKFWVEDAEEKKELLKSYRNNMGKKHCRYFARGDRTCPFGNECFYKHELRDGTKVDVGPPKRRQLNDARSNQQLEVRLDEGSVQPFVIDDHLN